MLEWMYRSIFLDLGTSWRWVVSFVLRPLYPWGKNPWYSLARRLGGPQSRSGRHGKVKILAHTRTRTPTPWSSARSQSLYRLSYPGPCNHISTYDYCLLSEWMSAPCISPGHLSYSTLTRLGQCQVLALSAKVGPLKILKEFHIPESQWRPTNPLNVP
jgi:hypothetical protein